MLLLNGFTPGLPLLNPITEFPERLPETGQCGVPTQHARRNVATASPLATLHWCHKPLTTA